MAEYVETLLAPDERIVTNARQHWAALIRFAFQPIAILVLAIVGLVVGLWIGGEGFLGGIVDTLLGLATAGLFVVAAVWLPVQALRWTSRRFVLTTRRVIRSDGLMRRVSVDAALDKINDVSYRQGFIGARLGFGDLIIATAAGSPLRLLELREANEFKKAIMVQQEAMVRERAATLMAGGGQLSPAVAEVLGGAGSELTGLSLPAAVPGATGAAVPVAMAAPEPVAEPKATSATEITATLASLTDMREDGTITDSDFEAKKQELLDRLD